MFWAHRGHSISKHPVKYLLKRAVMCFTLASFLVTSVIPSGTAHALIEGTLSMPGEEDMVRDILTDLRDGVFDLPQDIGYVQDTFIGTKDRVVIHVQDAHCDYYAQKAVSRIVKHLNAKYGVSLLCLEGGVGEYDLSPFTGIREDKLRAKVGDFFMAQGMLTGAEFAAAMSPGSYALWGVEDAELYKRNLKVYRDSVKYRAEVNAYLAKLAGIMTELKKGIYSEDLYQLDLKYAEFKDKKLPFKDYLEYTMGIARANLIPVKELRNVYLLKQVLDDEERIDFRKANAERDKFVAALQEKLSRKDIEEMVRQTLRFRSGEGTQKEYYNYLLEEGKKAGIDTAAYPSFRDYIVYISIYSSIDKSVLTQELARLEDSLRETLCAGDEKQAKLLSLSKNFTLVNKAFEIQLTKPDFDYYRENASGFKAEELISFIRKEGPGAGVKSAVPEDKAGFDQRVSEIQEFYDLSFQRDDVFLANVTKEMDETGYRTALLVTGGFHSDNLAALLRREGYTYVSILPRFKDKEGYQNSYFQILGGGEAPLGKTLMDAVAASKLQVASAWNRLGLEVDGERAKNSARIMVEMAKQLAEGKSAVIVVETPTGLKTITFNTDSKTGNIAFTTQPAKPGDESRAVAKITDPAKLKYIDHDVIQDEQIRECFRAGKAANVDVEVMSSVLDFFIAIGRADIAADVKRRMAEGKFQAVKLEGITGFMGHASHRGIYVDAALGAREQAAVLVHEIGAFYLQGEGTNKALQGLYGKFSVAGLKGSKNAVDLEKGQEICANISKDREKKRALESAGAAEGADRDYAAGMEVMEKESVGPETLREKLEKAWIKVKARFSGQDTAGMTAGTTAKTTGLNAAQKEQKIKEVIERYLVPAADVERLLLETDPAKMEMLRQYLAAKEAAGEASKSRTEELIAKKGMSRADAEKLADKEITARIKAKLNTQWTLLVLGISELGYDVATSERILDKFGDVFKDLVKEKLGNKKAMLLRRPGASAGEDPVGLAGQSMYVYEVNDPEIGKDLVLKFTRTETFLKEKRLTHGLQVYGNSEMVKTTGEKLRTYKERLSELTAKGMSEDEANRELDKQAVQAIAQAYDIARKKLGDLFAPMVLTNLTLDIQVPVYGPDKTILRDENGRIVTKTETVRIGPGEKIPYVIVQQRVVPVRDILRDLEKNEEKAYGRAMDITNELMGLRNQSQEKNEKATALRQELENVKKEVADAKDVLRKAEEKAEEDRKQLIEKMRARGVMDKDDRNWKINYGYNDKGELVGFDADFYAVPADMSKMSAEYESGPDAYLPGKDLTVLEGADIEDLNAEYPDTWAPVPAAFDNLLKERLLILLETLVGVGRAGATVSPELVEKVRSGTAGEKDLADLMRETMRVGMKAEPAATEPSGKDLLKVDISPKREAELKTMLEAQGVDTASDEWKVLLRGLSRIDEVLREENARPNINNNNVLKSLITDEAFRKQLIMREKMYEMILSDTDLNKAVTAAVEGSSDEKALAKKIRANISADKGYAGADAQFFEILVESVIEKATAGTAATDGRYDRSMIAKAIEKVANDESRKTVLEELGKAIEESLDGNVGTIEGLPETVDELEAAEKDMIDARREKQFLGDFPQSSDVQFPDELTLRLQTRAKDGKTITTDVHVLMTEKVADMVKVPGDETEVGVRIPVEGGGLAAALGMRTPSERPQEAEESEKKVATVNSIVNGLGIDPKALEKFLTSWEVKTMEDNGLISGYVDSTGKRNIEGEEIRTIYVSESVRIAARVSPQIIPILILSEISRADRPVMPGLAYALGMKDTTDAEAAFIIRGMDRQTSAAVHAAKMQLENKKAVNLKSINDIITETMKRNTAEGRTDLEPISPVPGEGTKLLIANINAGRDLSKGFLDQLLQADGADISVEDVGSAIKSADGSTIANKSIFNALVKMNYGTYVGFADVMGGFEIKKMTSDPVMDVLRPHATKMFIQFARERGIFAFNFGLDEHALAFPEDYQDYEVEEFFLDAMEEMMKGSGYVLYRGEGWRDIPASAKAAIDALKAKGVKVVSAAHAGGYNILVPQDAQGQVDEAMKNAGAAVKKDCPFLLPAGVVRLTKRGENVDSSTLLTAAEGRVRKWRQEEVERLTPRERADFWNAASAKEKYALTVQAWGRIGQEEQGRFGGKYENMPVDYIVLNALPGMNKSPVSVQDITPEEISKESEAKAKEKVDHMAQVLNGAEELVSKRSIMSANMGRRVGEILEKARNEGRIYKGPDGKPLNPTKDDAYTSFNKNVLEAVVSELIRLSPEERKNLKPEDRVIMVRGPPVDFFTIIVNDDGSVSVMHCDFMSPAEGLRLDEIKEELKGELVREHSEKKEKELSRNLSKEEKENIEKNIKENWKEIWIEKIVSKMKDAVKGRASDYLFPATLSKKEKDVREANIEDAFRSFEAGTKTLKEMMTVIEENGVRIFPFKALNSLYGHEDADVYILAHGVSLYEAFLKNMREAGGKGAVMTEEAVGKILKEAQREGGARMDPKKWFAATRMPMAGIMYETQMTVIPAATGATADAANEIAKDGLKALANMSAVRNPEQVKNQGTVLDGLEARIRMDRPETREPYAKAAEEKEKIEMERGEKGTDIKNSFMEGLVEKKRLETEEKRGKASIEKMYSTGRGVLSNVAAANTPIVVFQQCKADIEGQSDREKTAKKVAREIGDKYKVDSKNIKVVFYSDKGEFENLLKDKNVTDMLNKENGRAVVFTLASSGIHPKGDAAKDLCATFKTREGKDKVYYIEENYTGSKDIAPDPLVGPHVMLALGIVHFKAGNEADDGFLRTMDLLLYTMSGTSLNFKDTASVAAFINGLLKGTEQVSIVKLDFETFREQIKAEEAAMKSL